MTKPPAIHRIRIPNPFFEGATNVYVIAAEPITLIDTGIGTAVAYEALQAGLKANGLAIESIERVILTHHHLDHFGLAQRLHAQLDIPIYVHGEDLDAVTRYETWHDRFLSRMVKALGDWSTPKEQIVEAASLLRQGGKTLGRSVPAVSVVDGHCFPIDDSALEVIHTPGHSPGSICLRLGKSLFSGDHVLPDVSPNIGGGELGGNGVLARYLGSLRRVRDLQADDLTVYPGHGEPFHDLAGRVEELLHHHEQREEEIIAHLRAGGPLTVYEVTTELFGTLRGYHVVLGTAEAKAHLDKLATDGRIVHRDGRFVLR